MSVAIVHGVHFLAVRDLVAFLCPNTNTDAWRSMPHKEYKFTNQASKQPVISFTDALKLIALLPCDSVQLRAHLVTTLTHYVTRMEISSQTPIEIKDTAQHKISLIACDEIAAGATIRLDIVDGTLHLLSVRDIITHLCCKNADEMWRQMPEYQKNELKPACCELPERMITLPGAFKLVMFLPGESVRRSGMVAILTRVQSGLPSTAVIPFDEIVPGATVRLAIIDGKQFLSVRDVIMHVCGKDANHAADLWRTLSEDKKKEVTDYLGNFQFPGRGQSEQPVVTFPGVLKLIMFLPGEAAKKHRSTMATILTRYFAGDPTLLKEIEANSASTSPVCQLARGELKRKLECLETDVDLCCSIVDKIVQSYTALCQNKEIDDDAKTACKKLLLRPFNAV